jgi:hypothetical protein
MIVQAERTVFRSSALHLLDFESGINGKVNQCGLRD